MPSIYHYNVIIQTKGAKGKWFSQITKHRFDDLQVAKRTASALYASMSDPNKRVVVQDARYRNLSIYPGQGDQQCHLRTLRSRLKA